MARSPDLIVEVGGVWHSARDHMAAEEIAS
jgi:hypothetical protein